MLWKECGSVAPDLKKKGDGTDYSLTLHFQKEVFMQYKLSD